MTSEPGAIMKRPTTALVFKPRRWKKRRRVLLEESLTSGASCIGALMPTPTVGEKIKVGLPGESMWAEVTGTRNGRVIAKLLNESIHEEFAWGDEVVLGDDGYTVVEPADKVAAAQKAIEDWRAGKGRATS